MPPPVIIIISDPPGDQERLVGNGQEVSVYDLARNLIYSAELLNTPIVFQSPEDVSADPES